MSMDETVSFSLELNVDRAYEEMRRFQTVVYRSLDLIRRLSGDENLDRAIVKAQRFIAVMNQLRLMAIALYGATGPVGWIMGGLGAATTILSASDFVMEL